MDVIQRALCFANEAHKGQLRKYTNVPYIIHPINVAFMVANHGGTESMIVVALLHDVLEDTPTTFKELKHEFSGTIARYVDQLTDISIGSTGNRATRKELDKAHLMHASPQAKTIKLADLIDNSESIITHAPGFARIYMNEKRELLKVLTEGDPKLYRIAERIVNNYFGETK